MITILIFGNLSMILQIFILTLFLIIINGKTEINKHKPAKLSIRFESNPLISETEKSDAKINI